jgi:hypothetical protein
VLGFAVPGSLDQRTGGYTYDRHLIAALRALGCGVDVIDLGDGFPYPEIATRQGALERLREAPAGRPLVIDGLALGVLPEAAKALTQTHPVIALVHHPLALESGISPDTAAAFAAGADCRLCRGAGTRHGGLARYRRGCRGAATAQRRRDAARGRRGGAAQGLRRAHR